MTEIIFFSKRYQQHTWKQYNINFDIFHSQLSKRNNETCWTANSSIDRHLAQIMKCLESITLNIASFSIKYTTILVYKQT